MSRLDENRLQLASLAARIANSPLKTCKISHCDDGSDGEIQISATWSNIDRKKNRSQSIARLAKDTADSV